MRQAIVALLLVACSETPPVVNGPSVDECDRNRYVSDPTSEEYVAINFRNLATSDRVQSVCVQVDGRTAELVVRARDGYQMLLDHMIHLRVGSQHVVTVFASTSSKDQRKV